MNYESLTPDEVDSLKVNLDKILDLPYTAKNGIKFSKGSIKGFFKYRKNECCGTIQIDCGMISNSLYNLEISSTAYWTQVFGDSRGHVYTDFKNNDTTESALERLSVAIEKAYKRYHTF